MGKRAKGEGTGPFWSEARQRWVVQLPPGPDGRRPLRTAKTEAEALTLKKQIEAERAAGRDLSRKAETVAELLDNFLDTVEAHRRQSTARAYRSAARHITNRIGAMKYDAVTLETVQALADKLSKLTGPHQLRKALTILHRAYERVVPERVARNPVDWRRLTLGEMRSQERHPADEADVLRLLRVADDVELRGARLRMAIAWWLAALLGLRRGEIAGLTWRDLHWERSELHVRGQVATDDTGKLSIGMPTKTPDGVRLLPVGPRLLARLRQLWEVRQLERRRPGWKEHGLILCHEDGTPFAGTDDAPGAGLTALNYDLQTLCEAAGVPHTTPHQLRHTFATLVADEGYSEAVIAALLGHKRRGSVTVKYVHAKPKTMRAAVEAVEDRIFGGAMGAALEAQ